MDRGELSHAETPTRWRGHGLEAVEVAGESSALGEGQRGRATSHHLLHEPIDSGPDGPRGAGGEERADRQWRDGSRVQDHREATLVWFGDEMEGVGSGGRAKSVVLEPHDGKVGPVLVEDRPVGVSRDSVNHWRLQISCYINRRS
jgi:hypothetical protein